MVGKGRGEGMGDKVKLPREVAEAIDRLKNAGWSNKQILTNLSESIDSSMIILTGFCELNDFDSLMSSFDSLMTALANGYEVEETPIVATITSEQILEFKREYRAIKELSKSDMRFEWKLSGLMKTLDLFNIKIEGVNA